MQSDYFQHKTQNSFRNSSKLPQFKHSSLPKQLHSHASNLNRYDPNNKLAKLKDNLTKYFQKDINRRHSVNDLRENITAENTKSTHRKIIKDYFHRVHRLEKKKNIMKDRLKMVIEDDQNHKIGKYNQQAIPKQLKNNNIVFQKKPKLFSLQHKVVSNNNNYDSIYHKFWQVPNNKKQFKEKEQLNISLNFKNNNKALIYQWNQKLYNPEISFKLNETLQIEYKRQMLAHRLAKPKFVHSQLEPWSMKLEQDLEDFI